MNRDPTPQPFPRFGDPRRYVYAPKPPRLSCPACDSDKLRAMAGPRPQGDGSSFQYFKCGDCGHRFIVVWE